MSNPLCIVKHKLGQPACKYQFDPNYTCEFRGNGCAVKSLGPCVASEDKECIHIVLMREAVGELVQDGPKKLYALLEANGFDLDKQFDEYDHVDDGQIEYAQQREWVD